jgi:hypothetical protein
MDGPRNCIIKIDGYVDTSDVSVTGQIGASGFSTTIGSKNVVFVAGALVPTLGQYLTFSDGTTTFPAGTYVTGITDATHITVSNAALALNTAAAITITGTTGAVVLIDPALLSAIDVNNKLATQLRIDRIIYTIDEGLAVTLLWEATANVRVVDLVKAGHQELKRFGGYYNNSGAGKTGRILISTEGWSSGKIYEFTVTLELVKQ